MLWILRVHRSYALNGLQTDALAHTCGTHALVLLCPWVQYLMTVATTVSTLALCHTSPPIRGKAALFVHSSQACLHIHIHSVARISSLPQKCGCCLLHEKPGPRFTRYSQRVTRQRDNSFAL